MYKEHLKTIIPKAYVGPTRTLGVQNFPHACTDYKESLVHYSALFGYAKRELLPAVPTLKTQSWWPRSQAGLLLKACLLAGFSPLSEQFPGEQ